MATETERYDFDRVFRLLLTVGLAIGVVWLLSFLSDVLIPFAVALLLAYLLNPLVDGFEKKTNSRAWAVALTLSMFTVAVAVLVPLLGGLFVRELSGIAEVLADERMKEHVHRGLEPVRNLLDSPEFEAKLAEFKQSDSKEMAQLALGLFREVLPKFWTVASLAASFLGSALNAALGLTVVIIIFLYLVFLLMDFESLRSGWKGFLPPQYRQTIVDFVLEFNAAMSRYFRGQFLVAMSCGILFAIGFKIVGINMAILLGLFVGLLNMVPYLQAVGLIPAFMMAFVKALDAEVNPLGPIIGVLLVFAAVQVIQDAILVPRIMGKSTGLKPWMIMLSIFVWGKLLGFLGLVLAIPLSCLGLAYYRRVVLKDPQTSTTA